MYEKKIGTLTKENGVEVDHQRQIKAPNNVSDVAINTAQNLVPVSLDLNKVNKAYDPQNRDDEADKSLPMGVYYDKTKGKWIAACLQKDSVQGIHKRK